MSAGRIFKQRTKQGSPISPWASKLVLELRLGGDRGSDIEIEQAAKQLIERHKLVFVDCFWSSVGELAAGQKDTDVAMGKILPDVCMELKYGLDRAGWPRTGFFVFGDRQMWANYGTNSVFAVPDPTQLLNPIVYATIDEKQQASFVVKWFEPAEGVEQPTTPNLCRLRASQAFNKEDAALVFLIKHRSANKIAASSEQKKDTTLEDALFLKKTASKNFVTAFIDRVRDERGLTYEALEEAYAQFPDIAVRVKDAGDAKLAKCAAEMLHARDAIAAVVKALSGAKAPPNKELVKLVEPAWRAEPKLLGFIERRYPVLAKRYAKKLLRCVCHAACRRLVEMLRANKDVVSPDIAQWMLAFPLGVAGGIQDTLKKNIPALFTSYANSWPAAHAQLVFDRVTDEKSFSDAEQRRATMNHELVQLDVLKRRFVFSDLLHCIDSRIIDTNRELSPLLATMCTFLRSRVTANLNAADLVLHLLDEKSVSNKQADDALDVIAAYRTESDSTSSDTFCLVLSLLTRLAEPVPVDAFDDSRIARVMRTVAGNWAQDYPVHVTGDRSRLIWLAHRRVETESPKAELAMERVWDSIYKQAMSALVPEQKSVPALEDSVSALSLDDDAKSLPELEEVLDEAVAVASAGAAEIAVEGGDEADEESQPVARPSSPVTDLDKETTRDCSLPGAVSAESLAAVDAEMKRDFAAIDDELATADKASAGDQLADLLGKYADLPEKSASEKLARYYSELAVGGESKTGAGSTWTAEKLAELAGRQKHKSLVLCVNREKDALQQAIVIQCAWSDREEVTCKCCDAIPPEYGLVLLVCRRIAESKNCHCVQKMAALGAVPGPGCQQGESLTAAKGS